MRTADVVAGMRQIRDLLRTWGYVVDEVPGWESRGSGSWSGAILGQANHHDAFPARTGHAGGLRTCTFGRPDLRNSLCMFYLGSDGVVYLVAAKPSWHTGRAIWRGRSWPNSRVSGIEARNDGRGEAWPAVQLDAYAALNAATAIVFGFDEDDVADHKEIAVPAGRKIDRSLIDPAAWRRHRVRPLLNATPPTPAPAEEDDPMKLWNVSGDVYLTGGVHAVHIAERDDATVATTAKAYKLTLEVWPGNPDSFVDSHVIHSGGGAPRPQQSTVTS